MTIENLSRRVAINNATIRSLRPAGSDWFIRDTQQRGFQIKVTPSGKAIYQVEARLGGTGSVKKFKIGNVEDIELEEARVRAKDALDKIRRGIDPLLEKRALVHDGKTLAELVEEYIEAKELKERTIKDYRDLARRRFSQWLNRRVIDISRHEIRDWYSRGRTKSSDTDHAFRVLNAMMVFAKGLEIIKDNPCEIVTNARVRYTPKVRTNHLEPSNDLPKFLAEFIKYNFVKDSERVARDIILLILLTGLRSVEARTLKWSDVDFNRKQFIIRDTKNGLDHVVPMVATIYALLKYRKEHSENSPYVFRIKRDSKAGHITDFQKTLTNICKKAGIQTTITPHALRRTFATVLNSIGTGYADIKQLMNHKAKDITAGVYIRPDIEHLREILEDVVNFYDLKIPYFANVQSFVPYARGVLKSVLYGHGIVEPSLISENESEDPKIIKRGQKEYWEGTTD